MDLNKSRDFFDPRKVKKMIHIIGCGSIGSNVAELLVRYGIKNITLWDMDIVEKHNIANQIYTEEDVNTLKTKALYKYLCKINPEIKDTIRLKTEYKGETIGGYIFMCVDSVEIRNMIVDKNYKNTNIEAMFDFRTTLLEGQCYYADWHNKKDKESLKNSLNFTHEEAKKNTPVSACGFELSVAPVVKACAINGVTNFTNMINEIPPAHLILCQPYSFFLEAI